MCPMKARTIPTLEQIKADLAASEADIAAGRTVPADAVHQMMQERIDRLEARLSGDSSHKIASVRR